METAATSKAHTPLTLEQKIEAYGRMVTIRRFEKVSAEHIAKGNISGVCHSSAGQEASAVGACLALAADDYIVGTHRSHGHLIAKGADINGLMAELMGKEAGVCKGRGGEMHLADKRVGALTASGIVGGGIPMALGAALSAFVKKDGRVAMCFFGDGASNQGVFHESMIMAALWKLPLVFFCENNAVAAITPAQITHAEEDIAKRAFGHGIPGIIVDGQDLDAVYEAACEAVARARAGEGPSLVEAKTHRFGLHAEGLFFEDHRTKEELKRVTTECDPIINLRRDLVEAGVENGRLEQVEADVEKQLADAVSFGIDSPYPAANSYPEFMYATDVRQNYVDIN